MLEKTVRNNLGRLGPMLLRVGERSKGPLREELMRAVRAAETDPQTLEDLLNRIPANNIMLKDVAITICQRAVEMARMHGDLMVEVAMLERLARQLAAAGHKNEAADLSVEALDLIIRHSQGNEPAITAALFKQFLMTSQRLLTIRRTADSVDLLLRARDLAFEAMPTDPAFYMPQLAQALANLTKAYQALGRGTDVAASIQAEWELLTSLESIDDLSARDRLAGQLESRVSVLQDYIPRTEIIRAVSEAHEARLAAAAISEKPLVTEIRACRGVATVYDSLQCHDEAAAARENAELVWRRLAGSDLEAYGEGLAEVLMSRANQPRSDNEQAIELLREVVSIRRDIVDRRPGRGSSARLAETLMNLGDKLLRASKAAAFR